MINSNNLNKQTSLLIMTSKLFIDLLEILTMYARTWQSRYVSSKISLTSVIDQSVFAIYENLRNMHYNYKPRNLMSISMNE